MIARASRSLGIAALALTASILHVAAQGLPPPGVAPNPNCVRLESQLAALNRGTFDPAHNEQIRRYQNAAHNQQFELDRTVAHARRIGCRGSGFFSLFSGQPAQCGQLNARIQKMRGNLDRMLADLQRLQSGSSDREGQRRSLQLALAQNNCGPQYRAALQNSQPRTLFDALFGPGSVLGTVPSDQSTTFRTLCVRTCDGYYFPISYSTVQNHFAEDEQTCQRLCPSAEVILFTHRNPGEDVAQAVSLSGQPYSELSNAFLYRKKLNAACSCRAPGQSWAEALKQGGDQTIQRGDIVVTEERAKLLSQPRLDAQGKPIKPDARAKTNAPAPAATTSSTDKSAQPPGKRKVRTVGPAFYPVR
jgi:hypothetical protein